jgi:ABC-type transport system involved in multi-copper enzyme maturation permease subunit
MIASIRAEWRKNRSRPALLVALGLIAGITVLAYSSNWYLATHPVSAERAVSISLLYPERFLNNVMGAGFPLGAAMAIVLGAILAGSEYSWGTLKTIFTQGPGRLTTWVGRVVVFTFWTGVLTAVLFIVGAAYSAVIAAFNSHAVVWPAAIDIAKAFGAVWLILTVNGAIGMALGVVVRQSAAAIGIGVVYLLSVEIIAVRFIGAVSNGDYKWIGDLFVGQNASALIAQLGGTASIAHVTISAGQAVLVMCAWLIGLLIAASGLQRMRDVT